MDFESIFDDLSFCMHVSDISSISQGIFKELLSTMSTKNTCGLLTRVTVGKFLSFSKRPLIPSYSLPTGFTLVLSTDALSKLVSHS
jgi:hypothetical protein